MEESKHYCAGISKNGLDIVEVIMIVLSLIGLGFVILMTYNGCKQLQKLQKLSPILKLLYYTSLLAGYIIFISSTISAFICLVTDIYENFLNSAAIIAFTLLLLLILGTLLFRLYSSFSKSVYALSIVCKWAFIILYVIVFILGIWTMIERGIIGIKYDGNWNNAYKDGIFLRGYAGIICLLLYIFITVVAIWLFTRKLMQVTHSRMPSQIDVTKPEITLSPSQKKMVENTAKYVALLSLAIFTSILTSIAWMLSTFMWEDQNYNTTNSYLEELLVLITVFDTIVNLICLHLQFSFTSRLYHKYCYGLQIFWDKLLTMKIKKSATPKRNKFAKVQTFAQSEDEFI